MVVCTSQPEVVQATRHAKSAAMRYGLDPDTLMGAFSGSSVGGEKIDEKKLKSYCLLCHKFADNNHLGNHMRRTRAARDYAMQSAAQWSSLCGAATILDQVLVGTSKATSPPKFAKCCRAVQIGDFVINMRQMSITMQRSIGRRLEILTCEHALALRVLAKTCSGLVWAQTAPN